MARVKRGMTARAAHKKVLKLTEGHRATKHAIFRRANALANSPLESFFSRRKDPVITARSNAMVKRARALQERRGRLAHGLYPLEGVRLVEEALDLNVTPALVLYHEPLLQATERGS